MYPFWKKFPYDVLLLAERIAEEEEEEDEFCSIVGYLFKQNVKSEILGDYWSFSLVIYMSIIIIIIIEWFLFLSIYSTYSN